VHTQPEQAGRQGEYPVLLADLPVIDLCVPHYCQVLGSHYWALVSQGAPGIVAALGDGSPLLRPVERGTVSFVAQSVTPLHTAQLRTVFAYSHAHEDIQVRRPSGCWGVQFLCPSGCCSGLSTELCLGCKCG
jgi:hypothetical protein